MDQFIGTETLLIELLIIVTAVAMLVHRLRVPYTVALVIAGLAITFGQAVSFETTPELILGLFVPPLVFEAAFRIDLDELRHDLGGILVLAVPGVILTSFIVGAVVAALVPIGLPAALVFGALISATDPVAVVALFRSLNVPRRLGILVEGESLLNDGTAIVTFGIVLGVALAGRVDVGQGVLSFFWVTIGGLLIGLSLGWIASRLIGMIDDYLIEITITTVLAFGSYLLADRLGVSGVLAVVAAGLVNGTIGPRGMSPTTRIILSSFWDYVAFLANSLVFLLIGLRINVSDLAGAWQPVLIAVAAVLVSRFVVVYGLTLVTNRFFPPIPLRWQGVLVWSGLRGAVALALALALPGQLASADLLRLMTFGVVLFTLLVQATTVGPLLRRLGLIRRREAEVEYQLRHARLAALRMAEGHVEQLHREGLLGTHAWERLRNRNAARLERLTEQLQQLLRTHPELATEEEHLARREILLAERGALLTLRREGVISDEVFDRLAAEVDRALENSASEEGEDDDR